MGRAKRAYIYIKEEIKIKKGRSEREIKFLIIYIFKNHVVGEFLPDLLDVRVTPIFT